MTDGVFESYDLLDVMRPFRGVTVEGHVLEGWSFSPITNAGHLTVWQQTADRVDCLVFEPFPSIRALDGCEARGELRRWHLSFEWMRVWDEQPSVAELARWMVAA